MNNCLRSHLLTRDNLLCDIKCYTIFPQRFERNHLKDQWLCIAVVINSYHLTILYSSNLICNVNNILLSDTNLWNCNAKSLIFWMISFKSLRKDCAAFFITEKFVSCQQRWSKIIVHFKAFSFLCALIYILHLTREFTWQCALIYWGEGDVWWGTCKGDALSMGWTRLLRLSIICIRVVHVI